MSRGGKRQGAGRKPAPPRVAITVKVTAHDAARLKTYMQRARLSQSRALSALLDLEQNARAAALETL